MLDILMYLFVFPLSNGLVRGRQFYMQNQESENNRSASNMGDTNNSSVWAAEPNLNGSSATESLIANQTMGGGAGDKNDRLIQNMIPELRGKSTDDDAAASPASAKNSLKTLLVERLSSKPNIKVPQTIGDKKCFRYALSCIHCDEF